MFFQNFFTNNIFGTENLIKDLSKSYKFQLLYDYLKGNIINLDKKLHNIYNNLEFYNTYLSDTNIKYMIVHEVSIETIPFIKKADHLICFNEVQKRIIKEILCLDTPIDVIPYPYDKKNFTKIKQVLFSLKFDEKLIKKYIHVAKTWNLCESYNNDSFDIIEVNNQQKSIKQTSNKKEKFDNYNLCVYIDSNNQDKNKIDSFVKKLQKVLKNVQHSIIIDNTKMHDELLSISEYSYVFNEELDYDLANKLIDEKSIKIIYTPIKENHLVNKSISYGCKIIIAKGVSTTNLTNLITIDDYCDKLCNIVSENNMKILDRKYALQNSYTIDTINDINIIDGNILSNDYIFVVNFRNQLNKIGRCLESIIKQNKNIDFGIAVTDDMSNDGSINIVKNLLKSSEIDYVIIRNIKRKYSARNLWNASKLLINNKYSIIIEVDGDDYLFDNNVLDIVDSYHKKGFNKTCGSFITVPEWPAMNANISKLDFNNPWNQSKCAAWLPLRTYRKWLFDMVEIQYFMERNTNNWLKTADDASINPRMIELCNYKVAYINTDLYVYDVSGNDHDVNEEWSPLPSHRLLNHVITF